MAGKVFADDILQGKVAFVTGGGTGITGGIARAFAEHGARIAITSRKEENLIPMKQFIEENGGECLAIPSDVRVYDGVERAIDQTLDKFGKIDIVINGACREFSVRGRPALSEWLRDGGRYRYQGHV
jgi:NAD(P)-dependent dehydrogenase (short-subunit alcohol dehydrogenase family)